MKSRPYQDSFYNLSETVRSSCSRQNQAKKIRYLLSNFLKPNISESMPRWICLDIGCSSGLITREIEPLFYRTFGIEYDELSLNNVDKELKSRMLFIRGDAMYLPFADNSIPAMICAQVYEHVPDDRLLFSEIRRVLSPGGFLFFSGPNWLYPIEPHYFLPFLHWLPEKWASIYMKSLKKGDIYYERSRTWWSLRSEFRDYRIDDLSKEVVKMKLRESNSVIFRFVSYFPDVFWECVAPFYPNFNWIIYK